MENRKNQQPIKRPLKPSFGYILSSDPHDLTASLAPNYNNPNVASPTPTDPGQRLHSPFGSNGPSPSHSPISVDLTMPAHKRIPQQTCRKIDSYYRKTNENYLKSVPKTERQKSKIKRIAQLGKLLPGLPLNPHFKFKPKRTTKKNNFLDDAIFELEQMYKKLKLSDQDLLDRAERRDLPTKFQLMRFSSASQMPPISPTPMTARSDEEQPQPPNQSNNELNKRRPISAFYNQFQFQQQRTPPVRRSAVPDLVADDQAVRRLNSPLPPRTPTSSFQTLHQNTPIAPASAYLDTTPAYANQLQMQHSKKKNIYGRLEFDPIVDDVQYRKLSQNQSNVPAPHPPIGTPLNAHHIKPNPTNDYLHSLKSNDMAVRTLRKDKDYSVNQSNPFAKVLHHSGQGFYRDDDDLLPETTSNYLVNMKKQLKPTRSMILVANLDEGDQPDERTDFRQTAVAGANPTPVQLKRPFVKSSSLSNCLLGQQEDEQAKPQKPKNNIYRKPSSAVPLRNEEEQLEDLLSNLNQIPKIKSPDVVSANRFGIISRPSNNRDESGRQQHPAGKEPATELSRLELQQASLAKMMPSANENERTFGLVKSPTEFMNQPVRPQRVVKSRTHGSLSNEQRGRRFVSDKYEQLARGESNRDPTQDTTDQRCGSKNRLDKREELELIKQQKEQLEQEARSTSPKSIWPSQIKKQQKAQKEQKLKSSGKKVNDFFLLRLKPVLPVTFAAIVSALVMLIISVCCLLFIRVTRT